jgi:hypothetical protein
MREPFVMEDAIAKPLHDWLTKQVKWVIEPYVKWAIESKKPETYIRVDFMIKKEENGDIIFVLLNDGSKYEPFGPFSD